MNLRDLTPADKPAVAALNESEVPAVSHLEPAAFDELWDLCADRIGVGDDPLDGFALTVAEGSGYGSPNYRWLAERYDSFVYLDRICVAPHARQRGIGSALYDEVARRANADWFLAEVNIDPPNEPSLAFHRTYGFDEVGRARPSATSELEVVYFAKRLR